MAVTKFATHLWFNTQAEEAAKMYTSLLPDSHIDHVSYAPEGVPDVAAGSAFVVELTLMNNNFIFLNGGPHFKLDEAVSLYILCSDQAEIDKYWDALLADGGKPSQCGWLTDKFGLSWQVIPKYLEDVIKGDDKDKANRVTAAMLEMIKLDVAELEKAAKG